MVFIIVGWVEVVIGSLCLYVDILVCIDDLGLCVCGVLGNKVLVLCDLVWCEVVGEIFDLCWMLVMDYDVIIVVLVLICGIGCWIVEMMLMFCLGWLDILLVDDFGVCKGV